jgi:hypothetical protein
MWMRDRDIPWSIEVAALEVLAPWDEPGAEEVFSPAVSAEISSASSFG